ncbi:hypothetical protein ANTRET_LOCUS10041 [Anthophora retusa]
MHVAARPRCFTKSTQEISLPPSFFPTLGKPPKISILTTTRSLNWIEASERLQINLQMVDRSIKRLEKCERKFGLLGTRRWRQPLRR